MKSSSTIIGTALVILAFVLGSLFIVLPAIIPSFDEIPLMKGFLQTTLCQGDTLATSESSFSTPTSTTRSVTLSCVNSEGETYNVTSRALVFGVAAYLIPFFPGLYLLVSKRQAQHGVNQK